MISSKKSKRIYGGGVFFRLPSQGYLMSKKGSARVIVTGEKINKLTCREERLLGTQEQKF